MLAGKPSKLTCVSVLRMPMETSYKNSVSLRQENLNQFNVSVLRIPLDKQCFIKTKKPSIQCFNTQDINGQNRFIKTKKPKSIQCFSTQDINGQNSVSLRQGNLKQFNVSVLRILTENTVYH